MGIALTVVEVDWREVSDARLRDPSDHIYARPPALIGVDLFRYNSFVNLAISHLLPTDLVETQFLAAAKT